jgi:16S rRNA (cytosine967-C5)-methyltransferase
MISLFIEQYGKNTAISILKGLNSSPPVTVRVNTLKATFDEVFSKLVSLGYEVEEGNISPDAIRIINGKGIENNPLFNEGLITVQDESAMMVAPLMELNDNLTVIDLCSAPGGKTTHISEIMNNTGKILAFDIYKNKLEMIRKSSERLGIQNITLNTIDASILDEKLIDSADRVLIDVPCSGLGIIRKKPEIKWTKQYADIQDIMHIQRKIMSNAKRYVKPGGIMIYSTCTLAKEENEENIDWFLKNNPSFKIIPIECGKSDNLLYHDNGSLTILPNDKMDGFFISKLIRQL